MKYLSYIWTFIKALVGLGSQAHDDSERQDGVNQQKVDDLQQEQKDVLDAKQDKDAANTAGRADNVQWMCDNGFVKD